MSIFNMVRALPPIQLMGEGTFQVPVPYAAVAWEAYLFGAAGSGGCAIGTGAKATGGAGAGYAHIKRPVLAGVSSLTAILGAGGAAVELTSAGTSNGNDGATSSISDGTVTLTVPGAGGGKATSNTTACAAATAAGVPTVSDAGGLDYAIGGVSGDCSGVITTSKRCATGGGGAAGPWGNGGESGSIAGDYAGCSGGAALLNNSGNVTGDLGCSGGASQGGSSGDCDASITGSGGAGAYGPSANNSYLGGPGAPNSFGVISNLTGVGAASAQGGSDGLLFNFRGHCAGGNGGPHHYTVAGAGAGGGGARLPGGGNIRDGQAGGLMGGGGGIYMDGGQAINIGARGGMFGAGGGMVTNSQSVDISRSPAGGIACGGGAVASASAVSAFSGQGGNSHTAIIFYATS